MAEKRCVIEGKGLKKRKVSGWLHKDMPVEYTIYESSDTFYAELRQIIMVIQNKSIIYINSLRILHERGDSV